MRSWALRLVITASLSACGITPQQGLHAVGNAIADEHYIRQNRRLCSQKNDPALRFQCEQEARKEFQKFKTETGEKP